MAGLRVDPEGDYEPIALVEEVVANEVAVAVVVGVVLVVVVADGEPGCAVRLLKRGSCSYSCAGDHQGCG